MADAIDLLTTACVNKAKTLTLYEVWNKIVPSTLSADAYVRVTAAVGTSANVKQRRFERISVTFGIHTRNPNINADAIAGDIKDGIVDSKNNILISLDNPNMKVTYLNHSDNAPEALQFAASTFINRFVTLNFEVVTKG